MDGQREKQIEQELDKISRMLDEEASLRREHRRRLRHMPLSPPLAPPVILLMPEDDD